MPQTSIRSVKNCSEWFTMKGRRFRQIIMFKDKRIFLVPHRSLIPLAPRMRQLSSRLSSNENSLRDPCVTRWLVEVSIVWLSVNLLWLKRLRLRCLVTSSTMQLRQTLAASIKRQHLINTKTKTSFYRLYLPNLPTRTFHPSKAIFQAHWSKILRQEPSWFIIWARVGKTNKRSTPFSLTTTWREMMSMAPKMDLSSTIDTWPVAGHCLTGQESRFQISGTGRWWLFPTHP